MSGEQRKGIFGNDAGKIGFGLGAREIQIGCGVVTIPGAEEAKGVAEGVETCKGIFNYTGVRMTKQTIPKRRLNGSRNLFSLEKKINTLDEKTALWMKKTERAAIFIGQALFVPR